MITLNVIENKICGSYGETPFTVDYSKELYQNMQEIAKQAVNVTTVEEYNTLLEMWREEKQQRQALQTEVEELKASLARAKEDHQYDNLVHKKELEDLAKK